MDNSLIFSSVESQAIGNAGAVSIETTNLNLTNGGQISSLTSGEGNADTVTINATDSISVDNSLIASQVNPGAEGNAGAVSIDTTNLNLTNEGQISSSTSGEGNAGNVTINASDTISVDNNSGINAAVDLNAVGNAGIIGINTTNLNLTNEALIGNSILGKGNAGIISINASDTISVDNSLILSNVGSNAVGNAGTISINATDSLIDGATISTSNAGVGDAGNIIFNATNSFVVRNNSFITSNIGSPPEIETETSAIGRVGNITISSRDISLSDTSQIQAGAFPNGTATQPGIISLTATERISFTGTNTGLFSNNDPGSFGNASNVSLSAANIVFNDGAVIITRNEANGQGGDITIEGDILTLNASNLETNTSGEGNAGDININLTNSLELRESSSIRAEVTQDATGTGGNIDIQTGQVTVNGGSVISTSTTGEGNAGQLIINATDSIELDGSTAEGRSGFLATATEGSGDGGDITVITDELNIRNGATISASNFPSRGLASPGTGEAGNLTIEANSVTLNNNATIDAATRSGEGGIITLQVAEDIRLQNNSQISAQALEDANGGNVNINSRFILAFPSNGDGNDIIANAQRGDGGNINITAEALLGIEERPAIPGNGTNDIDASSQFGLSGNVTFNVPDTNNFQETAELSSNVVSAEAVAQDACAAGAGTSGLVLKGKGGVPPAPNLPLSSAVLLDNGKPIKPNFSQLNQQQTTQNIPSQVQPIKTSVGDIYPARGIIKTEDGRVILTAYPTGNNATRVARDAANCHQIQ